MPFRSFLARSEYALIAAVAIESRGGTSGRSVDILVTKENAAPPDKNNINHVRATWVF
jgi:hypothetical protein